MNKVDDEKRKAKNYFEFIMTHDIPFFAGRPVRETIINQEDIDNLKIEMSLNDDFYIYL